MGDDDGDPATGSCRRGSPSRISPLKLVQRTELSPNKSLELVAYNTSIRDLVIKEYRERVKTMILIS